MGEFDALVLGFFLIRHFEGQIVVPDFGFYGRDVHSSLIRQRRMIAGVNFLNELPLKLQRSVLLIKGHGGERNDIRRHGDTGKVRRTCSTDE